MLTINNLGNLQVMAGIWNAIRGQMHSRSYAVHNVDMTYGPDVNIFIFIYSLAELRNLVGEISFIFVI